MKSNILLGALLLVAAIGIGSSLSQPSATDLDRQIAERVIDLPNDEGAWHTTVVLPPGAGPENKLISWFNSDPRLVGLKSQTFWHVYHTNDKLYQERFGPTFGHASPGVLLQKPTGKVVYQAFGNRIPPESSELADEIRNSIPKIAPPTTLMGAVDWRNQDPTVQLFNRTRRIGGPQPIRNPNCGPDGCTPQPQLTLPWQSGTPVAVPPGGTPLIPGIKNEELYMILAVVAVIGGLLIGKQLRAKGIA